MLLTEKYIKNIINKLQYYKYANRFFYFKVEETK